PLYKVGKVFLYACVGE
ncbi:hypothetical protein ELK87_28680, partial [Klebsiella pneumoniae]|nr:hypothetical protein [Klebsiella pneumoniae]